MLHLLPALPDPAPPLATMPPPPRTHLVSLPYWSGWCLGITPGRVTAEPTPRLPPKAAARPSAPEAFRKKCMYCRRWFLEKPAYLYHPCRIKTFELVIFWDFVLEQQVTVKGRRKCSPFPRAHSRSFTRTTRRREESGKKSVETEFDVARESLRPRIRGECAPGKPPCPWCKKPIERVLFDATSEGSDGPEVREAHGRATGGDEGRRPGGVADLAGSMRVRPVERGAGPAPQERGGGELRVPAEAARQKLDPGERGVAADDPALRKPEELHLRVPRSAGDLGMRSMEGGGRVHQVPGGYGAEADRGSLPGPQGQRRELRAGQLPLGHKEGAAEEQTRLHCPHCRGRISYRSGVGGEAWGFVRHGEGENQAGLDSERRFVDTSGANHCRPCTWVSCRHHNAFTLNEENGSAKENYPHLRIWKDPGGHGLHVLESLHGTCSLDVADKIQNEMMGGVEGEGTPGLIALMRTALAGQPIGQTEGYTLDQVAKNLGISLERVRQIGARALQEVRVALRRAEGARPGVRRG